MGSCDQRVNCLDASDGTLVWSYNTDHEVFSSPAVAAGVVYVGSWSRIYAFGPAVTRPDLVVEEVAWYPTYPVSGSSVIIDVTVRNIGNGTALPYFTGQLSDDTHVISTAYYGSGIGSGTGLSGPSSSNWRPQGIWPCGTGSMPTTR